MKRDMNSPTRPCLSPQDFEYPGKPHHTFRLDPVEIEELQSQGFHGVLGSVYCDTSESFIDVLYVFESKQMETVSVEKIPHIDAFLNTFSIYEAII